MLLISSRNNLIVTTMTTCFLLACLSELPPETSGAPDGNGLLRQQPQHRHTHSDWLWLWDGFHGASDRLLARLRSLKDARRETIGVLITEHSIEMITSMRMTRAVWLLMGIHAKAVFVSTIVIMYEVWSEADRSSSDWWWDLLTVWWSSLPHRCLVFCIWPVSFI